MDFNCFILDTDPAFKKMASWIEKHPRFTLMPVENKIDAVSCRLFPPQFNPDITFIGYDAFKNNYDRIYTLIMKSKMVILLIHGKVPIEHIDDADLVMPFVTNYKDFSKWMGLFISLLENSAGYLPKFNRCTEWVAGLNKNKLLEVSVQDIVTIRRSGHTCYIGMLEKTLLSSHTFAELFMLYRSNKYMQISEDVVINLDHCTGFCMDIVRMANGANYQIGKRFRVTFWEHIEPGFLDSSDAKLKWNKFFRTTDENYTSKIRNECLEEDRIILSN